MKLSALLIIAFVFSFTSCKKDDIADNIPSCIHDEIAANKDNPNWSFANVEEYMFQNKLVYVFNPDNRVIADAASLIKDSDCNTLCHIGGYSVPPVDMCNGEVFSQAAILQRIIWEK